MAEAAHRMKGSPRTRRIERVLGVLLVALVGGSGAVSGGDLFSSDEPIELTIEAPFGKLLQWKNRDAEMEGRLEWRGGSVPMIIETFGSSRLRECEVPLLKMKIDPEAARGTPFEGHTPLRMVTHCRTRPSLERQMVMEYLAYRTYDLLTGPAIRTRIARIDYKNTGGRFRDATRYAFFVEDIGLVGDRHGLSWTEARYQSPSKLDPRAATTLALFQFMIGNSDYSLVAAAERERCCHNAALLMSEDGSRRALVPFDFDQSGLVDAPYAVPDRRLNLTSVKHRAYRGFCEHNGELAAVAAHFAAHRDEIEAMFLNEALPEAKGRRSGWDYLSVFFEWIEDPEKLEARIARNCRSR